MKYILYPLLVFLLTSCYIEDDYNPMFVEPIFVENPKTEILVDITYVLPSDNYSTSIYDLDETKYLKFLNGCFFHRYNIGLKIGTSKTLISSELFDLKDNRNNEAEIFNKETENSYRLDRLNIYIIPRANTYAIAGIGLPQRALITDEFLFKSTSPHEIGHSLGLEHIEIEGNIMSLIRPYLRKEFQEDQIDLMTQSIVAINNLKTASHTEHIKVSDAS